MDVKSGGEKEELESVANAKAGRIKKKQFYNKTNRPIFSARFCGNLSITS